MALPLTGIVLAGGAGVRFGGPEALASFGDDNCATLCVRKLLAAGLPSVVVVTGASAEDVFNSLVRNSLDEPHGVAIVYDPNWKDGDAPGAALALTRVAAGDAGALVLPVSYPLVSDRTLALLSQLFVQEPGVAGKVMVPLHEARLGYPVLVGKDLFGELAGATGDEPAMALARALPSRLVGVTVEDPGTLLRIETRDDHLRALRMLSDEEYDGGEKS